jgi:hypothetical protein
MDLGLQGAEHLPEVLLRLAIAVQGSGVEVVDAQLEGPGDRLIY